MVILVDSLRYMDSGQFPVSVLVSSTPGMMLGVDFPHQNAFGPTIAG